MVPLAYKNKYQFIKLALFLLLTLQSFSIEIISNILSLILRLLYLSSSLCCSNSITTFD